MVPVWAPNVGAAIRNSVAQAATSEIREPCFEIPWEKPVVMDQLGWM
jgi:hypothetical protein